MMDRFVDDLTKVWTGVGLPLRPRPAAGAPGSCPEGNAAASTCRFCDRPLLFARMEAREGGAAATACREANCPVAAADPAVAAAA